MGLRRRPTCASYTSCHITLYFLTRPYDNFAAVCMAVGRRSPTTGCRDLIPLSPRPFKSQLNANGTLTLRIACAGFSRRT